MDSVPFVSIVMPVRNESAFIERTLGAVLAQNYPSERMEVLVADGMSDDGMRDIVQRLIANNPHQSIRIIDNPRGIVPTGLNVAIQEARGKSESSVHRKRPLSDVRACLTASGQTASLYTWTIQVSWVHL